MRILIAEDDPTSRLVLERILAKWGYEVICATDGDQAWKILSQPGA
ncbi:MAG: response regulator, partial [Thermoleophilia bacterium]|nr:response regulator [Thermoleophilia bacterium]